MFSAISVVLTKLAFHVQLVLVEIVLRGIRLVALVAANAARMFGHVSPERDLVRQNFAALSAGGAAQVNLQVTVALGSRCVRLLAHPAHELSPTFHNHPGRQNIPRNPSHGAA